MTFRSIFHVIAQSLRPVLAVFGVKPKTVVGKVPDAVEAVDHALEEEDRKPEKSP